MYKLLMGSIFESKCDLLIIPCDIFGGVTFNVKNDISRLDLTYCRKSIAAGDVYFKETQGEFNNSFVIGYAASVNINFGVKQSSEQIVESIMSKIKEYSKLNSIRVINIPLLGTGAGNLDYRTSFELTRKNFENESEIQLNIFAFSSEAYSNLLPLVPQSRKVEAAHPRVFISYTGYDSENGKWVKSLAERLRKNGVDAKIDIYHLKPGMDLPQWMTNEIILADKVLLICDKHYIEKSDFRNGGVGWETMIIQGDMLFQNQHKNKYIAIAREKEFDKSLPIYLKSKYSIHWVSQEQDSTKFEELLLNIFECEIEPELGEIPQYILEKIHI